MDTKLCLMLVVAFLLGYYLRPVCSDVIEGLTCGNRNCDDTGTDSCAQNLFNNNLWDCRCKHGYD